MYKTDTKKVSNEIKSKIFAIGKLEKQYLNREQK